ncbi:serine protease [Aminobacter sp. P9b]|uniref:S1 family peptidase n=1 Tax=Aminobacter sp. P9b TaxID=3133697 RepID=UPI00324E2D6A
MISVNADGDQGVGSAFHVGDGVFVTARHVVEGMVSCHIELDSYRLMRLAEDATRALGYGELAPMPIKPLPHPNPDKDVAVFSMPSLASLPAVPLGDHLDDWITDHDFVLNEVLVLGFPPIPLSKKNVLFATRAQINAVVDLINVDHVHFIVSATARGGFSGGVVLSEWGVALGIVTSSLLKNGLPEELGYLTVLTVEPILECLAAHGLLPVALALQWDGLFTASTEHFGVPAKSWAHSWIETDRDGHRARISFATPDEGARQQMAEALIALPGFEGETELVGTAKHVWNYHGDYGKSEAPLEYARTTLTAILLAQGYLPVDRPIISTGSLDEPAFVDLLGNIDSIEQ